MKKVLFSILCLMMAINASAFEFDGINLNANVIEVTRQISLKGYVYDEEKDCLKGICQGTEIFLSINYADVSQDNKIGQLIIDIPMTQADALEVIVNTFNIIYHQTGHKGDTYTYLVDSDRTTLTVSKSETGIKLTYNTPYYKKNKR